MSNAKKMAVKKKRLLVGMKKSAVQNIPRVRKYLEDAEIEGVNLGVRCAEDFRGLTHAYTPNHTYQDLPQGDRKKYDFIIRAAVDFPRVKGLVDMAKQLQEGIPYDRR